MFSVGFENQVNQHLQLMKYFSIEGLRCYVHGKCQFLLIIYNWRLVFRRLLASATIV